MKGPSTRIPWDELDTLLLDMDGTLLDLAFDSFFWRELIPRHYAELRGMADRDARAELSDRYASVAGRLDFYCLDHWSRQTGLEIRRLKWAHRHLIGYLPGIVAFLRRARQRGKTLRIVTNAHPDTVAIKIRQTRLDKHVDGIVSSHDLGLAKETAGFWERLNAHEPYDPERSLLVEDNLDVLRAARDSGVGNTLAIRRPDSRHPARDLGDEVAVDGLADVTDSLTAAG